METLVIPITCIVSALIAAYSSYSATKKAQEERGRELEKRMNERDIELKSELASIATEVKLLSERVEKHNSVIERTYKLEADVASIWHRIDDIKIGGTD